MTTLIYSQPLPAVIEHTAHRIFDSFTDAFKARLNGRKERALHLALEGHVTHKTERIFSVRSENGDHTYLVDLARRLCTCPDNQSGNVCKHRLAAYLIEQAMQAVMATQEANQDEPLARACAVLNAGSDLIKEAVIYATIYHDGDNLPVEVVSVNSEVAVVRALPNFVDGKHIPQFPFDERQSSAEVLAKSLMDITIHR